MVSNMDRPPCQGFEFFLMQVRLAMLCHFLSSSFLWKALANRRTVSYIYRLEICNSKGSISVIIVVSCQQPGFSVCFASPIILWYLNDLLASKKKLQESKVLSLALKNQTQLGAVSFQVICSNNLHTCSRGSPVTGTAALAGFQDLLMKVNRLLIFNRLPATFSFSVTSYLDTTRCSSRLFCSFEK